MSPKPPLTGISLSPPTRYSRRSHAHSTCHPCTPPLSQLHVPPPPSIISPTNCLTLPSLKSHRLEMEISTRSIFITIFLIWHLQSCLALREDLPLPSFGPLVTKESRRTLVSTDSGSITAVDVQDRCGGRYHLQFITLDTSTLLLPVILHTDMVFYVHSGISIFYFSDFQMNLELILELDLMFDALML